MLGRGDEVLKDARRRDDGGLRGVVERHADHLDPEERRVGVLVRREVGAARQLLGRADGRGAGDVDVDVFVVVGVLEDGVGVRAAAGLHVPDVLGVADVGDVEDADAAEAVRAHRRLYALGAAVEPAAEALAGDEEEVAVDRHVALRGRAEVRRHELGRARVRDIPNHDPVVVALDHVVAVEGEVGVGDADEVLGGGRRGELAEVPDGLLRVEEAGPEADARIGRRSGLRPHRGTGEQRRQQEDGAGQRSVHHGYRGLDGEGEWCRVSAPVPRSRRASAPCARSR
jgi:hypothetical protein